MSADCTEVSLSCTLRSFRIGLSITVDDSNDFYVCRQSLGLSRTVFAVSLFNGVETVINCGLMFFFSHAGLSLEGHVLL